MANYAILKAAIAAAIKENGNEEITGNLLQQSLLAMVNSLGAGYQFAGVAEPETNPGTPDYNVFYFAGPGTYPNFNNATIPARNVGLLSYNGTWHVSSIQTTPFSAESIVGDIIQLYDGATPVYPRTKAEAVFFDSDVAKTLAGLMAAGYRFIGVATPTTNPGTPNQNVFYIAGTDGTYINFGGITLSEGETAILKYNGSWLREALPIPSIARAEQIEKNIWDTQHGQEREIDLSLLAYANKYVGADGKWQSGYNSCMLVVAEGNNVLIKANDNLGAIISVLKECNWGNITVGNDVKFSAQYPNRVVIQPGKSVAFPIPNDALAICIQLTRASGDSTPSYVGFQYDKLSIENALNSQSFAPISNSALTKLLLFHDTLSIIDIISLATKTWDGHYISYNTNYYVDRTYAVTKLLPVTPGEHYFVKANSNYSALIAFLKSDTIFDGNRPDFCDNCLSFSIPVDQTEILHVPEDAVYMAVCTRWTSTAPYDRMPEIYRCDDIQQVIADINSEIAEIKSPIHLVGQGTSVARQSLIGLQPNRLYKLSLDKSVWNVSSIGAGSVILSINTRQNDAIVGQFRYVKGDLIQRDFIVSTFDGNTIDISFRADTGVVVTGIIEDVTNEFVKQLDNVAFVTGDSNKKSFMRMVYKGDLINYKVSALANAQFLKIYSRAKEDDDYLIESVTADSAAIIESSHLVLNDGFLVLTSETDITPYCHIMQQGFAVMNPYKLPHQLKFDADNKFKAIGFDDSGASIYDNSRCQGGQIFQVSDSLYLMIYGAQGSYQSDAFTLNMAYSVDGLNWTRGIPAGYDAPYPGTNVVIGLGTPTEPLVGEFPYEFVNEFSICKTDDSEYPYRLFASIRKYNPNTIAGQKCWMFKSVDLVNWVPVRRVLNSAHDAYSAMFCKDGLIKVYIRMWDYSKTEPSEQRVIGLMWCDLYGNVIVPPSCYFGNGLYQASATDIGNERELLLPSRLYTQDNVHGDGTIEAYIADGDNAIPVPVYDLDKMTNAADGWRIVRNLVSINNVLYCLYTQFELKHGEADNHTSIMLCPVNWVTIGSPNQNG